MEVAEVDNAVAIELRGQIVKRDLDAPRRRRAHALEHAPGRERQRRGGERNCADAPKPQSDREAEEQRQEVDRPGDAGE